MGYWIGMWTSWGIHLVTIIWGVRKGESRAKWHGWRLGKLGTVHSQQSVMGGDLENWALSIVNIQRLPKEGERESMYGDTPWRDLLFPDNLINLLGMSSKYSDELTTLSNK